MLIKGLIDHGNKEIKAVHLIDPNHVEVRGMFKCTECYIIVHIVCNCT